MYISPIEVVEKEIAENIKEEVNSVVYESVRSLGVSVDKDELIRALNYHIQQYEKGYADGRNDEHLKNLKMWDTIKDELAELAKLKYLGCPHPEYVISDVWKIIENHLQVSDL